MIRILSESKKTNAKDIKEEHESPGLSLSGGRRVTLVRHGITEWNKLFRYQGVTDIPLSPEGEEQARRTGLRLSGASVRRIISSPLKRSLKTAGIIAEAVGFLDVEIWDELIEVDFGEWEGLTVEQIKSKFGTESFAKWRKAQMEVTPPNGEDTDKLYMRASEASKRIIAIADEHTLVVGHGAMFRAMLLSLIGVPKGSLFWKMRMDNCSISGLNISNSGSAYINFLNDTLHLLVKKDCIADLPLPW